MNVKQLINKVNSREWIRANELANSNKYRDSFVSKYGGIFEKKGNVWFWNQNPPEQEKIPNKLWLFTKNDGLVFVVDNFMEFCRNHDLSKSAMYELMAGKRKSHKGFVKVEKLK